MKRAIISDIHSNLEAFQAVLEDLQNQGASEIICLGDLVGYGPNPVECVDLMMDLQIPGKVCLLGNHDLAAVFDPVGFNSIAEQAIFWTRTVLEKTEDSKRSLRWEFLNNLLRTHRDAGFMYVHGSPRNPLNEYVFSDDIIEENKMEKLFSNVEKCCFQGHTHVPGIFTESRRYIRCQDLKDGYYDIGSEKLMVNVGSVGQPRDRDCRACYVLFDTDLNRIEYRRVNYDVEKTCDKIHHIPDLDDFLGDRIKQGK